MIKMDSATIERLKTPHPYPELLADLNAALGSIRRPVEEDSDEDC